MKFVIVGLGSIGKRHQGVLEKLGHSTLACHRDDNLKQVLSQEKPDGVLVCNPNNLHLASATTAIENGYHVFLEKPMSVSVTGVETLVKLATKRKRVLQVGYVLRFDKQLMKIKKQLEKKHLGKVYAARIEIGSYLPDWHPKEDYKTRYHSRKDLGGGVIGDLSHEIDYAYWLFGPIKKVVAMVKRIPELKIETEAMAAILMEHRSGVIAEIHLDYLQKSPKRTLEVIGEEGNLYWDYLSGQENKDDKFMSQMQNFIDAINGKTQSKVNGNDGLHVQKIIEAAKKSSKSGRMIKI